MLRRNFRGFTSLIDRARNYLKVRDHAAAVAFAEVAAFHTNLDDLLVCGSRQRVKQDGAAALSARFN